MKTTSTIEAEFFFSCFEVTSHGVLLKSVIYELKVVGSIERSLKLYFDNFVEVFIAKNCKSGRQSKHITLIIEP